MGGSSGLSVVLALVALLAGAGAASADVFVPADPPPLRSALCVAGAGDVLAAGRGVETEKLRVSVGGGGWRELPGLTGCPVIAAAGDGTMAIAGSPSHDDATLVVRPPGGAFGAPVALGSKYSARAPVLAAAPGGWVAAAWLDEDAGLSVLIVRPDGTSARTVVEPSSRDGAPLSDVHVGIDASGNVTVLWSRFERSGVRVQVARGSAGAAPVTADLTGALERIGGLGLSVAPGGATLIAWAGDDGVHASVDGQPAQIVDATIVGASLVAPAVADDGSAVLAYMAYGEEVVGVERMSGAWLRPRVLGSARPTERTTSQSDALDSRDVQAMIAPGGRAAVAWTAIPDRQSQVFGVAGVAGGAWGGVTRLSSITRTASSFQLAPDAAGVPRVSWSEGGLGARGASLAPAPLDGTAPAVTARFPSRIAPTVDGNIAVRMRVSCSEVCDARLAFAGGERDRGSVAHAFAPGTTGTLQLRASGDLQYELIVSRPARRLRLRLVVTDRAGNVVRRSATLRVRVLEPPIRSFKVGPRHRFGMDTPAGDRALGRLVNEMIETIARGHVSSASLARQFSRGFAAVVRKFGPDYTYSDEVGSALYDALWLPLARTHHDVGSILSSND